MEYNYFGYLLKQRNNETAPTFFVFSARVRDILEWSQVIRTVDSPDGVQRVLRETRSNSITRFFRADVNNTIPNSILLAFREGRVRFERMSEKMKECFPLTPLFNGCETQLEWGILNFSLDELAPPSEWPALVVDGQHRLAGMDKYKDENLPIVIVGIVDASLLEQAFQFIVINKKAVSVSTDTAKSIVANVDEKALEKRLNDANIAWGEMSPLLREVNDLETSPFYKLLDWDYNASRGGRKVVKITFIEQSIKYLQSQFSSFENDEDSLLEIYFSIWEAVKQTYNSLWPNFSEEGNLDKASEKFMSKVNLTCFQEFIITKLKAVRLIGLLDILSAEDVADHTKKILRLLPAKYWETEWNSRLSDTSAFKKIISDDLERLADNVIRKEPWNAGLQLPKMEEGNSTE